MSREYWMTYAPASGLLLSRGSGPIGDAAVEQAALAEGSTILVVSAEAFRSNPLDIDLVRPALWDVVKARRDVAINGGAPTPLGVVDSDEQSRSNITGAVVAAMLAQQAGQPFAVDWTMRDNSVVPLVAADVIAIGLAVVAHVDAAHANARELRGAIEAATDAAALFQIDVTAGWPAPQEN